MWLDNDQYSVVVLIRTGTESRCVVEYVRIGKEVQIDCAHGICGGPPGGGGPEGAPNPPE
jgi:hypothetical protein